MNAGPNNSHILTRQQLYDMVWRTPMIQLAEQFQLSDNGLRKVCKKYNIPVPKIGYWQKLRHGKEVSKTSLPAFLGEDTVRICPPIPVEVEPIKKFEKNVRVSKGQSMLHPLVEEARKRLSKSRTDKGRLMAGPEVLDIRVSPDQLLRACRIMDALIKALEKHGASVGINRHGEWKRFTYAKIAGQKVFFSLKESLKILKKEVDPDSYFDNQQEFVPNGKLFLYIKDYLGGRQTKWADGKAKKIEQRLTSFINGLWLASAHLKKEKEAREAERSRQEKQRKEYERKLADAEEEKKRLDVLEQQAASWQKSRTLRAFVRAAKREKGSYTADSSFAQWVEWATAHADRLDPFIPKAES